MSLDNTKFQLFVPRFLEIFIITALFREIIISFRNVTILDIIIYRFAGPITASPRIGEWDLVSALWFGFGKRW